MIYDVLAQPVQDIDFAPASKAAEILQNLRTIITTAKYSVPLDRDFGFNAEMLDNPVNAAQAQLQSEIIMAIKAYEPRVTVTGITITGTDNGVLIPKVQVMINDDE